MCDEEASKDVDGSEKESEKGKERVECVGGVICLNRSHGEHTSHQNNARNSIGKGHKRGMESRSHVPDH